MQTNFWKFYTSAAFSAGARFAHDKLAVAARPCHPPADPLHRMPQDTPAHLYQQQGIVGSIEATQADAADLPSTAAMQHGRPPLSHLPPAAACCFGLPSGAGDVLPLKARAPPVLARRKRLRVYHPLLVTRYPLQCSSCCTTSNSTAMPTVAPSKIHRPATWRTVSRFGG